MLSREGVTKQEGSWSDLRTLACAARPDKAGSVSSGLRLISMGEHNPDNYALLCWANSPFCPATYPVTSFCKTDLQAPEFKYLIFIVVLC